MNLVEALKTGRDFKRRGWDQFHTPSEMWRTINELSKEDFLADDYIIEHSISAADLCAALQSVPVHLSFTPSTVYQHLCKLWGLE
jgi:hypothetical protein